ncbi:MAG: glycosyltransferase [Galbitalea sp.]
MSLSVSVALCTYNSARFIEEQVESILNQTLLPAEVVVSDDGSTDDTLDRIRAVFAGYSGTPSR